MDCGLSTKRMHIINTTSLFLLQPHAIVLLSYVVVCGRKDMAFLVSMLKLSSLPLMICRLSVRRLKRDAVDLVHAVLRIKPQMQRPYAGSKSILAQVPE